MEGSGRSVHCSAAALWSIGMGTAPKQLQLCSVFLGARGHRRGHGEEGGSKIYCVCLGRVEKSSCTAQFSLDQ